MNSIRNYCDFSEFSANLLISKNTTLITDKNLQHTLLNQKKLDVAEIVKQIQNFT